MDEIARENIKFSFLKVLFQTLFHDIRVLFSWFFEIFSQLLLLKRIIIVPFSFVSCVFIFFQNVSINVTNYFYLVAKFMFLFKNIPNWTENCDALLNTAFYYRSGAIFHPYQIYFESIATMHGFTWCNSLRVALQQQLAIFLTSYFHSHTANIKTIVAEGV